MLASSRAPRAATRFRGRDKSRPYEQILCFGPNRNGRSPPGRRRAGCPHPAGPLAGANTPGGYGIRPYDRRRAPRPTGKLRPCHTTNPCRGRCSHRPGGPCAAARFRGRDKSRPYEQILCFGPNRNGRSPPGGRRAGCPHPAGPCAAARFCGQDKSRPYEQILCFGPNRNGRSPPGGRRAGCPHPAGSCAAAGFRGRDKSCPYEQILCFGPNRNGRGQFLIPHS